MRTLLSMVVVVLFSLTQGRAQSPTITVTGKVTDEKGVSVSGATVLEKNTRNATTTREDGTFTLNVKPKSHLVISYVGYESYEVAAGTNLMVGLNPDAKSLTDVVVTGVGVATARKKVPIDVGSVSSKDFAKSTTTSIVQALDGQIAGVQIQQTSGQPTAAFNIVLRGINSLDATTPLIMMDGVEIKGFSSTNTAFQVIDPSSIDHIEVVKGAAGGMLYGAQGANGVIQLFSKKGSMSGRLNINFYSKASVDNIIKGPDPILSMHHHFVTDANNNLLDQGGKPIVQGPTGIWTDPQSIDVIANPNTQNDKTYNLPLFDHLKQAFREASTFVNSVTVSGGSAYSDFALTMSQLNQQDVFSNNFSRTNINLNVGVQPFKGFSIRSNSQVMSRYENLLGGNRFDVFDAYPYVDFNWRDSTGHRALKTGANDNQLNSLSEQEWHQRSTQELELFQNFDANYKFPRFVELDFKYGIDYGTQSGTDYYLNQSNTLQPGEFWGINEDGSLLNNYTRYTNQNILSTLFVRTDFEKDFHLSVPIQTTTQLTYDYRNLQEKQFYAQGIALPLYPPPSFSTAGTKTAGDGDGFGNDLNQAVTTFGYLFNQTIDFGDLIGISGGFRSDYGSAFGAASKPFTFPRGTIWFRPSELLHLDWLAGWKLRAAYGKAGIQPSAYARQTLLTPVTGVGLSTPSRASNDSLALSVSAETEVGTDATINLFSGAWLHRVVLGATYWTRNTSAVYQNPQVAPSTGYASRLDNLSTIQSNGVDLSLDLNVFNSSNITWNMGLRWGTTQSKVTTVFDNLTQFDGLFAVKANASVGLFYGQYVLHSLNQLETDGKTPYIPAGSQGNYTLVNGNVVNKTTNVPFLSFSNDTRVIGNAFPDFTSAWFNTFTFNKALTVSFQFDWVHGNKIYNLTKQWLYTPAGGSGGSGGISADFDKKINVAGNVGSFVAYYQGLYNLVNPLDYFVENGSYIRLKDVSITYDMTRLVHNKIIRSLSATASGRNLLTFTKYTGMDPENTSGYGTQGNLITNDGVGAFAGVDYFGVPNLRSYQFSLNVGF